MPTSESRVAVTNVPTLSSGETQIVTTDTVNYTAPIGEGLAIRGVLNITPGASTTAIVVKCRKGVNTITGATVGPAAGVSHTLAAAASANIAFDFLDTAPVVTPAITPSGAQPAPGNVYTITVAQTAGTVAGTVNYGTAGVVPATSGW